MIRQNLRSERIIRITAALALIACVASPAIAGTYTFNLPPAGQEFSSSMLPLTVPVDLGVRFSAIESISVELVGRLIIKLYPLEDYIVNAMDPSIYIFLPNTYTGWPHFPERISDNTAKWGSDFSTPSALADFLDGHGEIKLENNFAIYMLAEGASKVLPRAGTEFLEAKMTVTGTVVPEPSSAISALLAVLASVFLARRGLISG